MAYPDVQSQPKFPAIEEAVSTFWAADQTFEASVQLRSAGEKGNNEFVFYDGPPFANGLPHYGHLLTGFVKDAVTRYQTMRGRRVERRFGWDCHGLPAEVEAEKEIGIAGHPEIAAFGIDKFNDVCRTSVLRYTSEWERYVTRQARWVDFSNDYKTLDTPYMESVMWAFHTLWEKGLIYEGFRVLPYCWRCETPLSNTETRMDDVYQDRQDPALTVWFLLESGERITAWTTTPWTLPSNLALAVGADIDYAVMQDTEGVKYILAESRLGSYEKEFVNAEQVATIKGSELAGRKYTPLFPFLADTENAFQVLTADFVSTEDGTGVVHLPPDSVKTTNWYVPVQELPPFAPWTTKVAIPNSFLRGSEHMFLMQTHWSFVNSKMKGESFATTRTTTRIHIVGVVRSHWCTAQCRAGLSKSQSSETAWWNSMKTFTGLQNI